MTIISFSQEELDAAAKRSEAAQGTPQAAPAAQELREMQAAITAAHAAAQILTCELICAAVQS